jgi:hypothetical protein
LLEAEECPELLELEEFDWLEAEEVPELEDSEEVALEELELLLELEELTLLELEVLLEELEDAEELLERSSIEETRNSVRVGSPAGPGNCRLPVWKPSLMASPTSPVDLVS